jgi:hypothetical protein
MNPVDKYLGVTEEGETKEAFGLSDAFKTKAMDAVTNAGAMAGVGAAVAGVSFGARSLYDAVTKRRDFKTMLEHNPDLHEHLERDPKFFNQAYSSLRKVNPQFSSEPLIAGNYMRQMMEAPLSAGGKIELALMGGRSSSSPVMDMAMKGMFEGAKSGVTKEYDPHASLRQEETGEKLRTGIAKQKGIQDREALMQQRRDQIRDLRGTGNPEWMHGRVP